MWERGRWNVGTLHNTGFEICDLSMWRVLVKNLCGILKPDLGNYKAFTWQVVLGKAALPTGFPASTLQALRECLPIKDLGLPDCQGLLHICLLASPFTLSHYPREMEITDVITGLVLKLLHSFIQWFIHLIFLSLFFVPGTVPGFRNVAEEPLKN